MPTIKNTDNASTGEDVEQLTCLEGMQEWYSHFRKFFKNIVSERILWFN